MERLKKPLAIVCAVVITVFVLAVSLLAVNTFVGGEVGSFFDPFSSLGVASKVIALFFPFILTVVSLLTGLILGKMKQAGIFAGCAGVLAVTHFLSPFITQFLLTDTAKNGFARFIQSVFTVLSMPAVSIPYAFNESVNLVLTDFAGSRIFVFAATFLSYATPIILTAGFLAGYTAQNKQQQQQKEEISG